MTSDGPNNPLGLNLDFLFGRGYLWGESHAFNDWITLDALRMEIPGLKFPFISTNGLSQFRHTRCLVRVVEISLGEVGFRRILDQLSTELSGFLDLDLVFLNGCIEVATRVRTLKFETTLTFRIGLLSPEPPKSDQIELSLYDYRAYGPLPVPARIVAFDLIAKILASPTFESYSRSAFSVVHKKDILSIRPFKLAFLHLFTKSGWKLPDLSDINHVSIAIRPGKLSILATRDTDEPFLEPKANYVVTESHASSALAAFETKKLLTDADDALFNQQFDQAIAQLEHSYDSLGNHPGVVARLFDLLLALPSVSNRSYAEQLVSSLLDSPLRDIALTAKITLLILSEAPPSELENVYAELDSVYHLRENDLQEATDLDRAFNHSIVKIAYARQIEGSSPEQAIEALKEAIALSPKNRGALAILDHYLEKSNQTEVRETYLRQLIEVETDDQRRLNHMITLAEILIFDLDRPSEARPILERARRVATHTRVEELIGELYLVSGQYTRAIKAFTTAIDTLDPIEFAIERALLNEKTCQIWFHDLANPAQANIFIILANKCLQQAFDNTHLINRDLLYLQVSFANTNSKISVARKQVNDALNHLTQIQDIFKDHPTLLEHRGMGRPDIQRMIETTPPLTILTHASTLLTRLQLEAGRPKGARNALMFLVRSLGKKRLFRRVALPELVELSTLLLQIEGEPNNIDIISKTFDLILQKPTSRFSEAEVNLSRHMHRVVSVGLETLDFDSLDQNLVQALQYSINAASRILRIHAQKRLLSEHSSASTTPEKEGKQTPPVEPVRSAHLRSFNEPFPYQMAASGDSSGFVGLTGISGISEISFGSSIAASSGSAASASSVSSTSSTSAKRNTGASEPSEKAERSERTVTARMRGIPPRNHDSQADSRNSRQTGAGLNLSDKETFSEVSQVDVPPNATSRLAGEVRTEKKKTNRSLRSTLPDSAQSKDTKESLLAFRREQTKASRNPEPISQWSAPDIRRLGDSKPIEPIEPARDPHTSHGLAAELTETHEHSKTDDPPFLEGFDALFEGALTGSKAIPGAASNAASRTRPIKKLILPTVVDSADLPTLPPTTNATLDEVTSFADEEDRFQEYHNTKSAIAQARQEASFDKLADRLLQLLTLDLTQDELLDTESELGQLYYFELEQLEPAKKLLEHVRQEDPDGRGRQPSLLTALEYIYQEAGLPEKQLEILNVRLANETNPDQAETYRLTIARRIWDLTQDLTQVTPLVDPILQTAPGDPRTHRLLADIAMERESWGEAARHLTALVNQPSGGLDEAENRRRLAGIYLHPLQSPERAIPLYEHVLHDAPGDLTSLRELRLCYLTLKEWNGVIRTSLREVALLANSLEELPFNEVEALLQSLPKATWTDAAGILSEVAKIYQQELKRPETAYQVWTWVIQLDPNRLDAYEQHLLLARELHLGDQVVEDLLILAPFAMDVNQQADMIIEAAEILQTREGGSPRANELLTAVIAMEGIDPDLRQIALGRQNERTRHD